MKNELVISRLIDIENKKSIKLLGRPLNLLEIAKLKNNLSETLLSNQKYKSFICDGDKVKKIIIAEIKHHDILGKTIHISYFYLLEDVDSSLVIKSEIKKICQFFKTYGCKILYTSCFSENEFLFRILRKNNFVISGELLVGKVKDGLLYLDRPITKVKMKNYTLEPANYKNDIDTLIDLYFKSKVIDESCIRVKSDVDELPMIKKYYRKMCSENHMWKLILNGKVIGQAGYLIDNIENNAHVCDMIIADKYQGKGLSKILYFKILSEMLDEGVISYSGVTTTNKVLNLAKKMKRMIVMHRLELNIKEL